MSELSVTQCYLELVERDIDPLKFSVVISDIGWVRYYKDLSITHEFEDRGGREYEEDMEAGQEIDSDNN